MNNMISFDNKRAVNRMVWIISSVLLLDLFSLSICILFKIETKTIYIILITLFAILILRLARLRNFKLEITDEQISIKYNHFIIKCYKPAGLELPWNKILFCKLQRGILSHYLCIGVSGKRRNQVFYYNLGTLSRANIHKIEDGVSNVCYCDIGML